MLLLSISFLILSSPSSYAKIGERECLPKDFRARMGLPRSQKNENTCWAFTAAKLLEENLCRQDPVRCGLELSVADSMRCRFTLSPAPPERALNCGLQRGICSEKNAPYPFFSWWPFWESSEAKFSALWNSPACSGERYAPVGASHLVVRGQPLTNDSEGLGLSAEDELDEKADLAKSLLEAFAEDRSSILTLYVYAPGSNRRCDWLSCRRGRHAVVLNGMRWDQSAQVCEVHVADTIEAAVGTGWHAADTLLSEGIRLTWIRSSKR